MSGHIIILKLPYNPLPTPIFCFHALDGGVEAYMGLANKFENRIVYGVVSPGLNTMEETPPETIEEMAKFYAQSICKIQEQGPYILIGWSFGGILAKAVADKLEEERKKSVVWLLDSVSPAIIQELNQEYTSETEIKERNKLNFMLAKCAFEPAVALAKMLCNTTDFTKGKKLEIGNKTYLAQIDIIFDALDNFIIETNNQNYGLDNNRDQLRRTKIARYNMKAVFNYDIKQNKKNSYEINIISTKNTIEKFKCDSDLGWKNNEQLQQVEQNKMNTAVIDTDHFGLLSTEENCLQIRDSIQKNEVVKFFDISRCLQLFVQISADCNLPTASKAYLTSIPPTIANQCMEILQRMVCGSKPENLPSAALLTSSVPNISFFLSANDDKNDKNLDNSKDNRIVQLHERTDKQNVASRPNQTTARN